MIQVFAGFFCEAKLQISRRKILFTDLSVDCNISIIRTHIHAKSVYIKKAFFSKIVSVKKLLNFLLISLKEYDSGVNRPLRRSDFHGFVNHICESTEQI